MAKILCVLYDDPITGYPRTTIRDAIPELKQYPDGQTLPAPANIDFTPGQLLGSVSGALGFRKFLEDAGHQLVVTSDKDVPDSVFEKELIDADVVISQPFWLAYLTNGILENWFSGKPMREEYLIVDGGKLAGAGAHFYSAGNATAGSEEAAAFKTIG